MDGSSPPSFTTPRETSYSQVNDYYPPQTGPQSFSDMNKGRPDSFVQDQSDHLKAPDGDPNFKRQPTFKDVGGDRVKSYTDPAVDFEYTNRGPGAVTQDGDRPKTIGDFAAGRKHTSGTVGASPYDADKIPSTSDVRPNIGSSGNQQGGYQFMSGPKSYNGDNFGQHPWFL
ncbi:hypothetical protein LXL04_014284 [Taraxacum kok-saghyz]